MIKNIIFDFGDVFLDLDKAATKRELERLNISEFSEEMLINNLQYEKGLLSSEEFISAYCESFPQLSAQKFTDSWNAILLKFPEHRLRFLQQLSKEGKYKLILLSNTNDIHIDWVKENIGFFEDFKNCFDAFYLSQEINLRKPDKSIFEYVLKEQDLKPEETLFIDDTPENTAAAAEMNIHTWNIDPATEDVVHLFQVKKELF
ncbi:putative hydrolase of the HAD superfamily [Salinimicrobium catena]|uniref:Putative hydrolase of the HAD superfamily n=1 Tax=Salinimicrobium catena TaxID=390640 RepID=A0A1H5KZS0_9FLAO|nr:HAD family phosphatase [Salinimicrobium catena]SDL03814.1 putative hydrolase of the HAD superfamily [Salinimicrobium catena]SEE70214.1 putative hydrolase of the HAD superfamily [Salinimicrobium catena]